MDQFLPTQFDQIVQQNNNYANLNLPQQPESNLNFQQQFQIENNNQQIQIKQQDKDEENENQLNQFNNNLQFNQQQQDSQIHQQQQQQQSESQNNDDQDEDEEDEDEEEEEDGKGKEKKSKPKKMFMCTFNGCGKSYSHTSGIRHHQREKHGQYNPEYYEKVDQSKSKEKRGRPKLQIKKEIQQTNLEDFFKKLTDQEEERERAYPSAKKFIKYEDKMMSFLLEKNIKFVLAVITEFGDPITHKCRNNLYIEDWDNFQSDPWKQGDEKSVDWDNFFHNSYNQENNSNSNNPMQQLQDQNVSQQDKTRMKEFVTRILQDIKKDVYLDFVFIFQTAWNMKFCSGMNPDDIPEENIVDHICQNVMQYKLFEKAAMNEDSLELTKKQFLEYIIHATFAYVKNTKNNLYDKYFGYGAN